jgi:hypothetical protein
MRSKTHNWKGDCPRATLRSSLFAANFRLENLKT